MWPTFFLQAGDGPGCLGARLLPEVPKPQAGLHRGLVERRQLGRDREELRITEINRQLVPAKQLLLRTGIKKRPAGSFNALKPAGHLMRNASNEVPVRCGTAMVHPCTAARLSSSADARITRHS